MKINYGAIFLKDLTTGESVQADFIEDVNSELIAATEELWGPKSARLRAEALARGIPEEDLPLDHEHWDWRKKIKLAKPGSRFLGVSWEKQVQGLMKITPGGPCRLQEQSGQALVYIDYIEIAPWNLPVLAEFPRFRRIGSYFIEAAIEISHENGCDGRIGLHSLKKAEGFYESCGMRNCGMEKLGYSLKGLEYSYFEMTPIQARSFVEGY